MQTVDYRTADCDSRTVRKLNDHKEQNIPYKGTGEVRLAKKRATTNYQNYDINKPNKIRTCFVFLRRRYIF